VYPDNALVAATDPSSTLPRLLFRLIPALRNLSAGDLSPLEAAAVRLCGHTLGTAIMERRLNEVELTTSGED